MLDFAECVKIARKFGIGDEVMKYFAQGRKFRLSVDETEELVRKAKSAIDNIPVRTVNVDSVSQKYLENLNKKSINKLTRREDGYEILKKSEEYFGDNVQFVNELIENTPGKEIYVEPEKLILNYLSKNKINVDSINIKQIINKNTNFNELKKIIDLINSNVKNIDPSLLKSVPLYTPVNKQTAYMKELNAILEKKGMTLEKYKQIVLRNIDDTSNLPPEGSEELKKLAETIREIREEVVGKMNKDVEFRKYITQQDLIKYLNGEKNTITGFIARECDANILDNYNEIFNSFRLDYPNTVYNPEMDNFIAYIKFKVADKKQINKIEIPYSPRFGGTNIHDKAPCSGTGILNSKNGLIIPELKVKYKKELELLDGAELHIQTRDGNDFIVGVFNKNKFIQKGEIK
jgi:ribosomal protein S25